MFTKKLFAVMACLLLLCLSVVPSFAEANQIFENDPVNVPNAEPTIDGKIDPSEGWSKVAYLNEDTAGHYWAEMQLTSTTDLYFAYSNEGLYFAASYNEGHAGYTLRFYNEEGVWTTRRDYIDANAGSYTLTNYPEKTPDGLVIEGHLDEGYKTMTPSDAKNAFWFNNAGNTVEYSTGPDIMDENYGFDGDVIALSIDPLGILNDAKNYAEDAYSTQYNIAIFKGDVVKIKTSRYSDIDYTDKCKAVGKITEDNMTFEIFIPKDIILTEAATVLKAFGIDRTITWEEFCASGAINRAGVTLMDRFYDPDAGVVDTWGRFAVALTVCDDGVEGWKTEPCLKGFGLKLVMSGLGDAAPDTNNNSGNNNNAGSNQPASNGDANQAAVTTQKVDLSTKAAGGATTTKTAATGGASENGEASQTFDAGIAVAIGLCAVAGIVFAYMKKKAR